MHLVPRHVDVEPLPFSLPSEAVVGILLSGVEEPVVVAVHREVQDGRVLVEHVLGRLAMVDIPVHHQHSDVGGERKEGTRGKREEGREEREGKGEGRTRCGEEEKEEQL